MQRIARIAAATFLLIGGSIHLELWRSGYRGIRYIGPLFVANVAVSAALIVAILLSGNVRIALVGMLFALSSLVALVMSRTTGLLGFTERTWTDMAVQATTAEIGAVVAIGLVMATRNRQLPALALLRSRRTGA